METWRESGYDLITGNNPYMHHPIIAYRSDGSTYELWNEIPSSAPLTYGRVEYPPLWNIICGIILLLLKRCGVMVTSLSPIMVMALKLPLLLAHLGLSWMLWKVALKMKTKTARSIALAYLFNPFAIYISFVWGQFDELAAFFLIASLIALFCNNHRGWIYSALFMAIAISLKLYFIHPLMLPLIYLKLRNVKRFFVYFLLTISILTLTSLPYLIKSPKAYLARVIFFHMYRTPAFHCIGQNWFAILAAFPPTSKVHNLAIKLRPTIFLPLYILILRKAWRVREVTLYSMTGYVAMLIITTYLANPVVNSQHFIYALSILALLLVHNPRLLNFSISQRIPFQLTYLRYLRFSLILLFASLIEWNFSFFSDYPTLFKIFQMFYFGEKAHWRAGWVAMSGVIISLLWVRIWLYIYNAQKPMVDRGPTDYNQTHNSIHYQK